MKTHLQVAKETHAIDQSYFENRLRDYIQNTLCDTIVDRYAHADDSESLSLVIDCETTIATLTESYFDEDTQRCAMRDHEYQFIYIHPLWEIFSFAEFQQHRLTIMLSDCDGETKEFALDFNFADLDLRARSDADKFMQAVRDCLTQNKVTVHADAFALNK